MSMHDIDKKSDSRLNPTPNVDDKVLHRMAHNTNGNTYRSGTVQQRMAFKQGMILTYDSENRVSSVYGYVPEANLTAPVLIIAKDGEDVFVDILGVDAPTI